MNQILSTEIPVDNNRNYNNYDKKKSNGASNIKKIIIFFAIAIIILGITILVITLVKNKKEKQLAMEKVTPQVIIEEVDNSVRVTATYEKGINKLEYYFNEENVTTIQANDKTIIEKLIDKPRNATKLNVKLTDEKGEESEFTKEFAIVDSIKPIIETEVIATETGAKLKITVQDELGISSLKYKWTDGEEVKIDATEENQKVIETQIDIERATKDITIIAIDNYENTETITKTIVGKYVPEITVIQYGNKAECKISHDKGFKKIVFNINGTEMIYDESKSVYDPTLTTFECSIELKEGENKLIIQAYSMEDTEKEYKGKCSYIPET